MLLPQSAVTSLEFEEKRRWGELQRGGHQAKKRPSSTVGPGASALSGEGKEHPSPPSGASPAPAAGEYNLHGCLCPQQAL